MTTPNARAQSHRRLSPRGISEGAATLVIALGVFMLMQPFSLDLYGWSFTVILAGTVMFMIGSKLPE
jgi:hypothetical protein